MIVQLDSQSYHANPALSHSRLKAIDRSPAHFKHLSENGGQSSDALDFGRLFHAFILEPDTVASAFAVAPDVDRRTTAGKAAWREFSDANGDRTIVTASDMQVVRAMSDAISAAPCASELVFDAIATGRVEEAHRWHDVTWNVARKAKMDAVLRDGTVIDLKTTLDASPRAFERSILTYGYHTQAAFYADAMDAAGDGMRRFVIVAIEKNPPYAIGVYELSRQSVVAGRVKVNNWLSTYVDCVASGSWPGYTTSTHLINLPKWANGIDANGGIEDF